MFWRLCLSSVTWKYQISTLSEVKRVRPVHGLVTKSQCNTEHQQADSRRRHCTKSESSLGHFHIQPFHIWDHVCHNAIWKTQTLHNTGLWNQKWLRLNLSVVASLMLGQQWSWGIIWNNINIAQKMWLLQSSYQVHTELCADSVAETVQSVMITLAPVSTSTFYADCATDK